MQLSAAPQHPYTAALLAALPERSAGRRIATIPGVVPGLWDRPSGCLFGPRCAFATERSRTEVPELRALGDGRVRCHYPLGDPARDAHRAADGPIGARPDEAVLLAFSTPRRAINGPARAAPRAGCRRRSSAVPGARRRTRRGAC